MKIVSYLAICKVGAIVLYLSYKVQRSGPYAYVMGFSR